MSRSEKRIREIINGLLKLQDMVLGKNPVDPWVKQRALENVGNVAMIQIIDEDGVVQERLKLDKKTLKIVRTNERPKHVISMHIDVFLDLLSGDLDFRDAYVNGLVDFRGTDYHAHAMMWAKAFERLRKYIIPKFRRR